MKKTITLLVLCLLPPASCLLPLHAQTHTYAVDPSCGCDIHYVDGIQTTRDGNLYGFKRYDGTVIVPNIYPYVGEFLNGYCHVWQYDTSDLGPQTSSLSEPPLLAGLIDSAGRTVVPCLYDAVDIPNGGRIAVVHNGLVGYYDLLGNLVIQPVYPIARTFSEGRAAVATMIDSTDYLFSFIDTLGRQVLPPIYENALPFVDGYAPVMRYQRWGIIDRDGNEIVPFAFEHLTPPDHNTVFAGNEQDEMALFILPDVSPRRQIAPATPFIYAPVTAVTENRIGVYHDGKQGFLDLSGNEVIPCIYDEVGLFRYGRTLARNGDLHGIIDTLGDTILPIAYHNRTPNGTKYAYYDSLALVEQDYRLGFVDLDGHFVVPLILQAAYQFSEGTAAVLSGNLWGYIDTSGQLTLPLIFDRASPFQHQRADVTFHGRHLIIDPDGHCTANCNGIISFK